MRRYRVIVWAVDNHADGEALVGDTIVLAHNKREATAKAMDALWDDRLDTADCRPVVDVQYMPKSMVG